jgi:DNA polymerase III delta prime subunit
MAATLRPLFSYEYSPQRLDEFLNPELVTKIRSSMAAREPILLVGEAATGKTSWIQAMISEYYPDPVSIERKTYVHVIHTLKEQGIQYYRNETKTFCQTTTGSYQKIIVIDDMDQMNEQSQQVFRNFIDKYHVLFLCSCTNLNHIIESIQTRFTIVPLPHLTRNQCASMFDRIVMHQGIQMDAEARDYLLDTTCPNTKVMVHLLEKMYLLGERVTLERAQGDLFLALQAYTQFIQRGELHEAIRRIYDLHERGYSVIDLLDQYFLYVKATATATATDDPMMTTESTYKVIELLCKYIAIFHNIHDDKIELALFSFELAKLLQNPRHIQGNTSHTK